MNTKVDLGKRLEVIMISTIRPNLIEKTISSWVKNASLNELNLKLTLHIDNIGLNQDYNHVDNIKAIKKYFTGEFEYHYNEVNPSHSKAFKWGFNKLEKDYLLWLDDDWTLDQKIDLEEICNNHEKIRELAHLRFAHKKTTRILKSCQKGKNKNYMGQNCETYLLPIHNSNKLEHVRYEDFFIPVGSNKFNHFAIHPGIYKKKFIDDVKKLLNVEKDPELEFKMRANSKEIEKIINEKWVCGIYGNLENNVINDIGREWMNEKGFKKKSKRNIEEKMVWERVKK